MSRWSLLALMLGLLLVAAPFAKQSMVAASEEYDEGEGEEGGAADEEEKDVVVLTTKNWDSIVPKSKFALVRARSARGAGPGSCSPKQQVGSGSGSGCCGSRLCAAQHQRNADPAALSFGLAAARRSSSTHRGRVLMQHWRWTGSGAARSLRWLARALHIALSLPHRLPPLPASRLSPIFSFLSPLGAGTARYGLRHELG